MASFWSAAFQGDEERVNELLDAGQEIDAHPPPGASAYRPTALANAVWGNRPEMVQLLLERGANPNLYDGDNNYSPLHWASYRGDHAECAELLVEAGSDITARSYSNRSGFTPLEMALGKNQVVSRKPGVMLVLEAAERRPRPAWTPPRIEPRSPAPQPTPLDEPPSPVLHSQSELLSPFGSAAGSIAQGAGGASASSEPPMRRASSEPPMRSVPSASAAAPAASPSRSAPPRRRSVALEFFPVAAALAGVAALFSLPAPFEPQTVGLLFCGLLFCDLVWGLDHLVCDSRDLPTRLASWARRWGGPSRWWKARVPAPFLCPITGEVMADPVSTADGHTYERAAIERWLRTRDTSPMTGAKLMRKDLTPAISLRQLIEDFDST